MATFVNAIIGLFFAITAVLLYAEEVNEKVNPKVLKFVGFSLGFFAVGQAFIPFFYSVITFLGSRMDTM